jgi:hypothetical protein
VASWIRTTPQTDSSTDSEPLIGRICCWVNSNYVRELSDAEHHAGAQAEIILCAVDSVWQLSEKVIRLNGTDGNVPGDANVESTACDHREISCIAGGAGDDREVRIEPMNGPEEALREEREFAVK